LTCFTPTCIALKEAFFTTFLVLVASLLLSQTATVTVHVTGIEKIKGDISIALYDHTDDFPSDDKFVQGVFVPLESPDFAYSFKDVEPGTYAIAVYQDLDRNRELNKNWMGIPREPYGFSNNAKGKMGPPDYEDASFEVNGDIRIVIQLN
jgi:uncharacterized protein (DUF2141 family)